MTNFTALIAYIADDGDGWTWDDGGRGEHFKGEAGDCVTRAIAIAAELPYRKVYDQLGALQRTFPKQARGKRSPRDGVPRSIYEPYLTKHLGFTWTPTMRVGSGCTVHLRADDLPSGRIVARLSKHLCAVVDGMIHDTHDPSRDGTRCVYGYYSR